MTICYAETLILTPHTMADVPVAPHDASLDVATHAPDAGSEILQPLSPEMWAAFGKYSQVPLVPNDKVISITQPTLPGVSFISYSRKGVLTIVPAVTLRDVEPERLAEEMYSLALERNIFTSLHFDQSSTHVAGPSFQMVFSRDDLVPSMNDAVGTLDYVLDELSRRFNDIHHPAVLSPSLEDINGWNKQALELLQQGKVAEFNAMRVEHPVDWEPDFKFAMLDNFGQGLDLSGADLRFANLEGAEMIRANLTGADLGYANLKRAKLPFANLRDANLYKAILDQTNLHGVFGLEVDQLVMAETFGDISIDRDLIDLAEEARRLFAERIMFHVTGGGI